MFELGYKQNTNSLYSKCSPSMPGYWIAPGIYKGMANKASEATLHASKESAQRIIRHLPLQQKS